MFWINFDWLVTAEPYSLEANGDRYRMNSTTKAFWKHLTEYHIAMAVILDIMTEKF